MFWNIESLFDLQMRVTSVTERKIFASDEDFSICNISDADRSDYVELHRQLNRDASLYFNPNTFCKRSGKKAIECNKESREQKII